MAMENCSRSRARVSRKAPGRGLGGLAGEVFAGDVEEGSDAVVEAEAGASVGGEDPRWVGGGRGLRTHREDQGDVVDVAPGADVAISVDAASLGHPEVPVTRTASRRRPDAEAAFVDKRVVPTARQDEVVEIGRAAVRPGEDVVGVEVGGGMAARELADALVTDLQRPALGSGGQTPRTAQAEHLASASHQHALHLRTMTTVWSSAGSPPLAPTSMLLRGTDGPEVEFVPTSVSDAVEVADAWVERLLDEGWQPQDVALLTTGARHPVQKERQEASGFAAKLGGLRRDRAGVRSGCTRGAAAQERKACIASRQETCKESEMVLESYIRSDTMDP